MNGERKRWIVYDVAPSGYRVLDELFEYNRGAALRVARANAGKYGQTNILDVAWSMRANGQLIAAWNEWKAKRR